MEVGRISQSFKNLSLKDTGSSFAVIAEYIGSCSNLKELGFCAIQSFTDRNLMRSLALSRKLERLEISVPELSTELSNFMKINLRELKILVLNFCKDFSPSSIQSICELDKL